MKFTVKILPALLSLLAMTASAAVPVSRFGARGDGVTDDAPALQKAFDSDESIFFENKTYLLSKPLVLNKKHNKSIDFGGAMLAKQNRKTCTVRIAECSDIRIRGGLFIIAGGTPEKPLIPVEPVSREEAPDYIDAHGFMIVRSDNISVRDVHINGSWQMGFSNMDCTGLFFENNTIENCARDGIYCHNSSNVRYLCNRLNNIRDDALSFHDYGQPPERKRIAKITGSPQAGDLIVIGNIIRNAYQGVASIGCNRVTVTGNQIDGTVNAGICVFNSDRLHPGTKAQVANVVIADNLLSNTCKDTSIMGRIYKNGLDTCTARAAICAQAQGMDHLMPTATRRLSNVVITGNNIRESGTQGIMGHFVDNLVVNGNLILNCNTSGKDSTRNILETVFCTNVQLKDNTVIDDRPEPLHGRGWSMRESDGVTGGFLIKGFRIEEGTRQEAAPFNWKR